MRASTRASSRRTLHSGPGAPSTSGDLRSCSFRVLRQPAAQAYCLPPLLTAREGVRCHALPPHADWLASSGVSAEQVCAVLQAVEGDKFEAFTVSPLRTVCAGELCHTAFSPCGAFLATATEAGDVKIWNVSTGEQEADLRIRHQRNVDSVSAADDKPDLQWLRLQVESLCWSAGGQSLVLLAASHQGTKLHHLRVPDRLVAGRSPCDGGSLSELPNIEHDGARLTTLAGSPDGLALVARRVDGSVLAWRCEGGTWVPAAGIHFANNIDTFIYAPLALSMRPDVAGRVNRKAARMLAVVGKNRSGLTVWDLTHPKDNCIPEDKWMNVDHPMEGVSVSLSTDGALLAAAGCGRGQESIHVYDMGVVEESVNDMGLNARCEPMAVIGSPGSQFSLAALTPCGGFVLSADQHGAVDLWGVATGLHRCCLRSGGAPRVDTLRVSSDGGAAAAALENGDVLLWLLKPQMRD